jgi:hypothetical protein
MKLKSAWAVFVALGLSAVASAQLTINVDTSARQYYLSGSATGAVGGDEEGGYKIFWDNAQPYNGGFPAFLAQTAFIATGNTTTGFTMFIHGNGNVNGVLNFSSGNNVTLTGDSTVRFDYSVWASTVITELESKAALGETVATTTGSSQFTLTFATAAIPEPTTYAALLGGAALLGAIVRRRRRDHPSP